MKTSSKTRDDLLYTYVDKTYTIYQVIEVLPEDSYDCVELNIEN